MTPIHPPIYLGDVSTYAVDALLGGSHGWLRIPAGGNLDVRWLPKKGCYRLTIDVTAGHRLEPKTAAAFNAQTLARLQELAPEDRTALS